SARGEHDGGRLGPVEDSARKLAVEYSPPAGRSGHMRGFHRRVFAMLAFAAAWLAIAACHAGSPGATPPAPNTGVAGDPKVRVVVVISAGVEWKILRTQIPDEPVRETPYGQWLVHHLGGEDVVFFHGGYGKV